MLRLPLGVSDQTGPSTEATSPGNVAAVGIKKKKSSEKGGITIFQDFQSGSLKKKKRKKKKIKSSKGQRTDGGGEKIMTLSCILLCVPPEQNKARN